MKNSKNFIILSILSLAALSSCAAGSATAGYSVRSQSADNISPEAEDRIVERAKNEALLEIMKQKSTSTAREISQ